LDDREIWVGTDDGNLQLTRDDGAHWTNLIAAVPDLGPHSWVSSVHASAHHRGRALVSFDRHTQGDRQAYVYLTDDYGVHFQRLDVDHQIKGYVHVVKEDPANANLVYVGSEQGLWVSIDQGAHFVRFTGGQLPPVAVRDLAFAAHDDNLVLATHGRGLWIIDDLTPLRDLASRDITAPIVFLNARPTEQRIEGSGGWPEGDATYHGENPAAGAVITYYQSTRHVFGRLTMDVVNDRGEVVATLTPGTAKGINRVTWSMQVAPPRVPTAAQAAFAGTQGPRVLPGVYTVRLTTNGVTYTQPLTVGLDHRADYSVEDRRLQYAAAMKAHALFSHMSDVVDRLNGLKALLQQTREHTTNHDLREAIEAVAEQTEGLRKRIVATTEGGAITGEERLREHLDQVYSALLSYEGRPSVDQEHRVDALATELGEVEAESNALINGPLQKLNRRLQAAKVPPIRVADAATTGQTLEALLAWQRLLHPEEQAVANERD